MSNALVRRVVAYRSVFGPSQVKGWIFRRAAAYGLLFCNDRGEPLPPARIVLGHLARFCRANSPTVMFDSTGRVDALASARMDGRREVYLLIMQHLHADDRLLLELEQEAEQ